MIRVGITGGTGFIGRHLTAMLIRKEYDVVVFTTKGGILRRRKKHITYSRWDPDKGECDVNAFKTIDVIVNLAGAGIADKRWTEKRKKEIRDSRIKSTEFLVSILNKHPTACKTLITASATGFYGPDGHYSSSFTEMAPSFNDFLGNTCKQWEVASENLNSNIRRVVLRFGIVLSKDGGAFQQFANPMSYGVMPILGSGGQVVSWIEMHDLMRLILFTIEHREIAGIYNAVAPDHVSSRKLVHAIAAEKGGLKIPFHVPSVLLKVLLGEMSHEILKSCTVSADKVLSTGFIFDHPDVESAIKYILGIKKGKP